MYLSEQVELQSEFTALSLDGSGRALGEELAARIHSLLEHYQSQAQLQENTTPSTKYVHRLQKLQEKAHSLWQQKHAEDYKIYTEKRQSLENIHLEPVAVRLDHHIHSCSNTRIAASILLEDALHEYFHSGTRHNLISVTCSFDGSGGGGAQRLEINGSGGERLVSSGGLEGRKFNGNMVYYNPDSTELRVILQGGGWGGGVCTNPLQMKGLDFTIVRTALALSENTVYNQPYKSIPPPAF